MPGAQELFVIVLVALFVLGPERLPEVARGAARLLTRIRNYGVTASKELRGVTGIGDVEHEVAELRRELERTRADLRRAIRETRTVVDPTPLKRPDVAVDAAAGVTGEGAGPTGEVGPTTEGTADGTADADR